MVMIKQNTIEFNKKNVFFFTMTEINMRQILYCVNHVDQKQLLITYPVHVANPKLDATLLYV